MHKGAEVHCTHDEGPRIRLLLIAGTPTWSLLQHYSTRSTPFAYLFDTFQEHELVYRFISGHSHFTTLISPRCKYHLEALDDRRLPAAELCRSCASRLSSGLQRNQPLSCHHSFITKIGNFQRPTVRVLDSHSLRLQNTIQLNTEKYTGLSRRF